ncbi:MAG: HAMP domain-containing histidine kinase [Anaerolineae bacterium]|nr:HAMP domain-containing histidine kinase [Anaerolineae bacterium]
MANAALNRIPTPIAQLSTRLAALIEPPAGVKGLQRRQAQMLSGVLLTLVPIAALINLVTPLLYPELGLNPALMAAVVVLAGLYLLSRSNNYQAAALLTVIVINTAVYGVTLGRTGEDSIHSFNYILAVMVLSSITLPLWVTGVLMLSNVIVLQVLPLVIPTLPSTVGPTGVFVVGSVFLLVFMWYRDVLERDRQAEVAIAFEQTRKANELLKTANDELKAANKLAQDTIRLKSEFVSTISHELRTPLNAVLGFCGIMLEGMGGEFDDDARHMLERINANSTHLLTLINEVLDLAKIESGRIELVNTPFSPADLAGRWQTQMGGLAEKRGIKLDVKIDPALPSMIVGDTERLSQVGINLLSNAIKFTEKGGVTLRFLRQDTNWVLEVEDTGIGIPPHALNYIFDEFRQVDGSSRRVYGGSGLGLAIVRNLVRMMSGQIKVASELNKGSTFTVILPLVTEQAPAAVTS